MGIQISLPLTGAWVPLANINITDTNTHTYLTNPPNSAGKGIDILHIGDLLGSGNNPIKAYALWILNNENQTLTVQPVANVVSNGTLPDIPITGTQFSVNSGNSGLSIFPFYNYALEYFTVYLSFSTTPTGAGNSSLPVPQGVYAVLYIYYG